MDAEDDDRELGRNHDKREFDTPEELAEAIDNWQQAGRDMDCMPWRLVKREETVLGTMRRKVDAEFVPELADPS